MAMSISSVPATLEDNDLVYVDFSGVIYHFLDIEK
jgi:hypothetical protein